MGVLERFAGRRNLCLSQELQRARMIAPCVIPAHRTAIAHASGLASGVAAAADGAAYSPRWEVR
jgi:hypothetical protein